MRRAILGLVAATALCALGLDACGKDERLVSTPSTLPDASGDASMPPADAAKDAGSVIRTVETRSRFGALDPSNTLLDGDFEYSGMDAMQYPWFGLEHTFIVTGASCHQGLRCVKVPNLGYILGIFVWPDAVTVDVAYYAKPFGSGNCSDEVGGLLIPIEDYAGEPDTNMIVSATEPEPEPDGWCHVSRSISVPSDTGNVLWALLLAPRQKATGAVLFDDASIRVAGSASTSSVAAAQATDLTKLAARARAEFAKRPPPPARAQPRPVENPTGRRAFVPGSR